MDRKKELKRMYKESRREMGIYIFQCNPTDKVYIGATDDTKTINSITARLAGNNFILYPNLQNDWNTYGRDAFTVKVADVLEYDKDETKTDYSEDLQVLLDYWIGQYENTEVIHG